MTLLIILEQNEERRVFFFSKYEDRVDVELD